MMLGGRDKMSAPLPQSEAYIFNRIFITDFYNAR